MGSSTSPQTIKNSESAVINPLHNKNSERLLAKRQALLPPAPLSGASNSPIPPR
jgi:hypothetical protein